MVMIVNNCIKKYIVLTAAGGFHVFNEINANGKWVVYDAVNSHHGVTEEYLKSLGWIFRKYVMVEY